MPIYVDNPIFECSYIRDQDNCAIGEGTVLKDCNISGKLVTGKNCKLNGVVVAEGCALVIADNCTIARSNILGGGTVTVGSDSVIIMSTVCGECIVGKDCFLFNCFKSMENDSHIGDHCNMVTVRINAAPYIGDGSVLIQASINVTDLHIGNVLIAPVKDANSGQGPAIRMPLTTDAVKGLEGRIPRMAYVETHAGITVYAGKGSYIKDGVCITCRLTLLPNTEVQVEEDARVHSMMGDAFSPAVKELCIGRGGSMVKASNRANTYVSSPPEGIVRIAPESTLLWVSSNDCMVSDVIVSTKFMETMAI